MTQVQDRPNGYTRRIADELRKGDRVEWRSHGGTAIGCVVKKITSTTTAATRKVRASKEEPQYRVKSDKSGGEAVHRPSALKRTKKRA